MQLDDGARKLAAQRDALKGSKTMNNYCPVTISIHGSVGLCAFTGKVVNCQNGWHISILYQWHTLRCSQTDTCTHIDS